VSTEEALDYVGGWTAGNDISSRKLQSQPHLTGKMPQFGFSKGFDTYAPMGPVLVANDLIGDPEKLHITTKVNGEIRQDEGVHDLLFDCKYLISYLSQGSTLKKGTVIMTGTPGGELPGTCPAIGEVRCFANQDVTRGGAWDEAAAVSKARHHRGSHRVQDWNTAKRSRV